mgnify:CR=1 FL=1
MSDDYDLYYATPATTPPAVKPLAIRPTATAPPGSFRPPARAGSLSSKPTPNPPPAAGRAKPASDLDDEYTSAAVPVAVRPPIARGGAAPTKTVSMMSMLPTRGQSKPTTGRSSTDDDYEPAPAQPPTFGAPPRKPLPTTAPAITTAPPSRKPSTFTTVSAPSTSSKSPSAPAITPPKVPAPAIPKAPATEDDYSPSSAARTAAPPLPTKGPAVLRPPAAKPAPPPTSTFEDDGYSQPPAPIQVAGPAIAPVQGDDYGYEAPKATQLPKTAAPPQPTATKTEDRKSDV